MIELPATTTSLADCWNHIGVWGDRTCPELLNVVHCHNCPVFARVGRQFLNAPAPEEYIEEWTRRLEAPQAETESDLQSVLAFRIGIEWLALPVPILIEVTHPRPIHRIPHRGGFLSGLVNVRGELYLCVRLGQLLGFSPTENGPTMNAKNTPSAMSNALTGGRLLVAQRDSERWVFQVDEVDQVLRLPTSGLSVSPATVARSLTRLTRGVFVWRERTLGLLDDARLFHALRTRIQ